MPNYCCICIPKNTVETLLPPDKYDLYLCVECTQRLNSMRKTYALEQVAPPTTGRHNASTGYHFKSDVK